MKLAERVALVTGASRGIGQAVAVELASEGARVGVHYCVERAAAEATAASLHGDDHACFQADLGDPESTQDLIESVVNRMGRIDILVNNAGVFEAHSPIEVNYEVWRRCWARTLEVNLMGAANACFCAAQHMIADGGGRIINISSRGAFRGEPLGPAYGASKAGLNALSQSLAKALAPYGIFVGVIAPGGGETDMAAETLASPEAEAVRQQSPLGRVGRPDEIARAVAFLAMDGADYLTGCIIDANGASYLRS